MRGCSLDPATRTLPVCKAATSYRCQLNSFLFLLASCAGRCCGSLPTLVRKLFASGACGTLSTAEAAHPTIDCIGLFCTRNVPEDVGTDCASGHRVANALRDPLFFGDLLHANLCDEFSFPSLAGTPRPRCNRPWCLSPASTVKHHLHHEEPKP